MLQEAETQPLQTDIGRRLAEVVEWVVLQPIFEVCANATGYRGEGRHRETWWCQEEANKQLGATLEDILEAERDQWQWESGRRGGDKEWE